jgi:glycosyltransferase involved in cell wall biosynthesis
MRGARALLLPRHEDFGMTPLEVKARGRPVIAFGKGDALVTIVDDATGLLVPEQSVAGFVEGLERFERLIFDSTAARESSFFLSRHRLNAKMRAVLDDAWGSRIREVAVRA